MVVYMCIFGRQLDDSSCLQSSNLASIAVLINNNYSVSSQWLEFQNHTLPSAQFNIVTLQEHHKMSSSQNYFILICSICAESFALQCSVFHSFKLCDFQLYYSDTQNKNGCFFQNVTHDSLVIHFWQILVVTISLGDSWIDAWLIAQCKLINVWGEPDNKINMPYTSTVYVKILPPALIGENFIFCPVLRIA